MSVVICVGSGFASHNLWVGWKGHKHEVEDLRLALLRKQSPLRAQGFFVHIERTGSRTLTDVLNEAPARSCCRTRFEDGKYSSEPFFAHLGFFQPLWRKKTPSPPFSLPNDTSFLFFFLFFLQPLRLDIKRQMSSRSDRVKSVDVHPTEPWTLVALYNGHVHVWNHETLAIVKSFEICELPVRAARFIPRKNWVVSGSVSKICGFVAGSVSRASMILFVKLSMF